MVANSTIFKLRKYFLARGVPEELVSSALHILGCIVAGPYGRSSFTAIRARSKDAIVKFLNLILNLVPLSWIVDATKVGWVLDKNFLKEKAFWAVNKKLPSDKLNTLYDLVLNNPISAIVTLDESDNIAEKSGCMLLDIDRPKSSPIMAAWGDFPSKLDGISLEQQAVWLRTNLELNMARVPICDKSISNRFHFRVGDSYEPLHANHSEGFHTLPMILEVLGGFYNPFIDTIAAMKGDSRNPLESPEVCKSIAEIVSGSLRRTIPLKLTARALQVYEAMQELEKDNFDTGHTVKEILENINGKGSDIISLRTVDRGRQELLGERWIEKLAGDRYKTSSNHNLGNTCAHPDLVYLEAEQPSPAPKIKQAKFKHSKDEQTSDGNDLGEVQTVVATLESEGNATKSVVKLPIDVMEALSTSDNF